MVVLEEVEEVGFVGNGNHQRERAVRAAGMAKAYKVIGRFLSIAAAGKAFFADPSVDEVVELLGRIALAHQLGNVLHVAEQAVRSI